MWLASLPSNAIQIWGPIYIHQMLDYGIVILMNEMDLNTIYSPMWIYSSHDNDRNAQIS